MRFVLRSKYDTFAIFRTPSLISILTSDEDVVLVLVLLVRLAFVEVDARDVVAAAASLDKEFGRYAWSLKLNQGMESRSV